VPESLDELIKRGEGPQDAVWAWRRRVHVEGDREHTYLIAADDGDLLINTGLDFEAPEIKARFGRVSNRPLRAIVFTQGHPEHDGGWSHVDAPGVETIDVRTHGAAHVLVKSGGCRCGGGGR